MTGKIFEFPGVSPQVEKTEEPFFPDADLVSVLERLLDRVCSGETVSVAFAEVLADGTTGIVWRGGQHFHHLNSAVSALHYRMNGS